MSHSGSIHSPEGCWLAFLKISVSLQKQSKFMLTVRLKLCKTLFEFPSVEIKYALKYVKHVWTKMFYASDILTFKICYSVRNKI